MQFKFKSFEGILLIFAILIFIMSVIPRFFDIMKFLPDYSIDENEVVENAVGFMGGDLDMYWYKHGTLCPYIFALIYSLMSLFYSQGFDKFVQNVFFNNNIFYFTARFFASCLSLLLAYFSFRLSKKYFNRKIAYIVLVLAVFPFAELLVHFKIRIDTLLAVWTFLGVYFTMQIPGSKNNKYYLLSGLFWGMGIATKPLPGLVLLPTVFLAHYFRIKNDITALQMKKIEETRKKKHKKQKQIVPVRKGVVPMLIKTVFDKKIYYFILFAFMSNFVFNPYSLIKFKEYMNEQTLAVRTGGNLGGGSWPEGWRIFTHFNSLGYVFIIILIISIIYFLYKAIKNKNQIYIVMTSYPLIYWLTFAKGDSRYYWYITILPFLIIMTAVFLNDLAEKIRNNTLKNILICVLLVGILSQPALYLVKRTIGYNKISDYRSINTTLSAKKWIEENIPRKKKILLYGSYTGLPRIVDFNSKEQAQYGEYFMYYRWNNQFLKNQFRIAHANYIKAGKPTYDLLNIRHKLKNEEEDKLFDYCLDNNVDYVATYRDLSSYPELENRILKVFDREEYPYGRKILIYKVSDN